MEEKILATSDRKIENKIKLAMIEKMKEVSGLPAETLNILNNIDTDKYEDTIYEIEDFINDKIYEIMEDLEPEDYEEFYFDRKDAIGCYSLGFSGKGVLVFDLNDECGFVGFDEGEDVIKAKKTEVKFNEEGNPYLDFSHDDIMLDEVMRLNL